MAKTQWRQLLADELEPGHCGNEPEVEVGVGSVAGGDNPTHSPWEALTLAKLGYPEGWSVSVVLWQKTSK